MEKVIAKILKDVGIGGIDDLRSMGSLKAIGVICTNQSKACVNMLYALESVIRGVEMEALPEKDRRALKRKYEQMLKGPAAPAKKPSRPEGERRPST